VRSDRAIIISQTMSDFQPSTPSDALAARHSSESDSLAQQVIMSLVCVSQISAHTSLQVESMTVAPGGGAFAAGFQAQAAVKAEAATAAAAAAPNTAAAASAAPAAAAEESSEGAPGARHEASQHPIRHNSHHL
jgi:hypothetical protein